MDADRNDPTLGLGRARVNAGDLDLRGARDLLWRLLVDTSRCYCKADPVEAEQQDAAEALGWCRAIRPGMQTAEKEQIERERAAQAEQLRREIHRQTGEELATSLDPKNLSRCTDAWAQECPMRPQWQCLRNRALEQAEERAARAHSAITRGVPADIAEGASKGQLARTEALRKAWAVLEGGLKFKRLLLFSSDDTGEGAVAAGYLLYKRGVGRFVSVPELRFARHDDPLRAELLHHDVLALVDIPAPPPRPVAAAGHLTLAPPADLPRQLLDLLEAAIERVVRVRGKLVLTTRGHSSDLLQQFGPRTQEAFAKWGHIHPVVPEAKR